ncbi:uncharacterized protein EI97DRAFT_378822, partial [Westerdykella ornata]
IKALKEMHEGVQYDGVSLESTESQKLQPLRDKECEDSLESTIACVLANASPIYGPSRHLDIIRFAPFSGSKKAAAIVEHQPAGNSYTHCRSAREDSRRAAIEHPLVSTEDTIQRLLVAKGISWRK